MKKVVNRIEEHMTEYPSITSRKTSVLEASQFMQMMEIRHLPVVEEGKVVGIISDRDLSQARLIAECGLTVGDFMTPDPYCVEVGTPLSIVAREMAAKKYGSTVIQNMDGQVVGIFTTTDGMRLLSTLLDSEKGPEIRHWGVERLLAGNWLEMR